MKKLLTVTLFTGLLTSLRIISGLVIAKVVAVYTGPTGIVMLGQVQSLFNALNGFVASPVGSGLVRYTAENNALGYGSCAPWWKASLKWVLLLLAVAIPFGCLFSKFLASYVFGDAKYFWLVVVTSLALPFSVANTLIASVLNGQHQYRRFIYLGIFSLVIATFFMVLVVINFHLYGAMIAAALFISVSGLAMLIGSIGQPWMRLDYWFGNTSLVHMRGIGAYVVMAVASALTFPLALLVVRKMLISQVGWEQAGHWQAVWRISEVYLGVITIALSTYFLPKLSSLNGSDLIVSEIKKTAKIIMPIVLFLAIVVYFSRDLAISLVFTEDFRPARDLFSIQLVGDVFKILSWLYAYPMVSRGAVKWFISTEVFFSFSFTVFAYFFILKFGVSGANMAYAFNYLIYLFFVYVNVKRFSH